jgi:hypothetical protein
MLVLSSTVSSRYYTSYTGGLTSPGNYGFPLIHAETRSAEPDEISVAGEWSGKHVVAAMDTRVTIYMK